MADPRFFHRLGPFPLDELARVAGAVLSGDPAREVRDVAPLELAGPDEVAFLDNPRYREAARATRAGACIVRPEHAGLVPEATARLESTEPYRAYASIAAAFYPEDGPPGAAGGTAEGGIAPGAHVDPSALLGPGVAVAAGAVVEAGARIGAFTRIAATATIGRGVVLGEHCRIGPGASLTHCLVGSRVIVHAGARIGQDGFGFAMGAGHLKVPQLGRVIVEDEVEIGANTTVDRGAGPDTVIGRGSKIDNLVQIAHNVQLGEGCVIVAQSGIAGSTRIGAWSVLAAQSGVTGHLTIGPRTRLAARTAVIGDLEGGADYGGAPAMPAKEWRRQMVAIRRLGRKG
jgi:UDP-3-O-[3-hydroxymyristoyl] glucosamine N-acyltransferase